jgi:RsiW-degrading membrane proteinase PrsW (M82 family)
MVKKVIAIIGLLAIHVISYFVILPMAQNSEDRHFDSLYLVLLYIGLAIALWFSFYKLHSGKGGIFHWLISILMLSIVAWAVKLLFLECSVCTTGP